MTLQEWTAEMRGALRQAGFDVTEHMGFPLVRTPSALPEKVRLMELPLPLAHEKRIYAEGMVIVPCVRAGE